MGGFLFHSFSIIIHFFTEIKKFSCIQIFCIFMETALGSHVEVMNLGQKTYLIKGKGTFQSRIHNYSRLHICMLSLPLLSFRIHQICEILKNVLSEFFELRNNTENFKAIHMCTHLLEGHYWLKFSKYVSGVFPLELNVYHILCCKYQC